MRDRSAALVLRLEAIEGRGRLEAAIGDRLMEFHVSRAARDELGLEGSLFQSTGNVILPDFRAARNLARRINEKVDAALLPERAVRAGRLNAMALIDEILHYVARLFRERAEPRAFALVLRDLEVELGAAGLGRLLAAFTERFPPVSVYRGELSAADWLAGAGASGRPDPELARTRREQALEEILLLRLANENPAFGPFRFLFDESVLAAPGSAEAETYAAAIGAATRRFAALPFFGPEGQDLVTMLRSPAKAAPYSLPGQLEYIKAHWGLLLGDRLLRLLGGLDLIREEERPRFPGPGPTRAYVYSGMEREYERFTQDRDWMPHVVMMAKSTLVWLFQLSATYGRDIRTLDAIPDEELDTLASRGFNALWLIGLWERSPASAEIKRRCGNPEAAPSAYSLFDYEIAAELGGWAALERLREKCGFRGLRLAADMVPNHVGLDSAWVRDRPELLMSSDTCPFPGYEFSGGDLSGDGRVDVRIEEGYYDRTDAAVVFRRVDRATGRATYVYHGNDGTGMPWNDTAQIDFLKPAARDAVKERILHVARNFPIIRFDAAMILARRHFRRLWYPEPGSGGDIPSRAEHAMGAEDFDRAMPQEFWREVVDMCAHEAPDTLLLAEAFWMMEGYFVRTLGMHRVYNSAFMNMLKREENAKYRETIRNTQEFDKDILKRFVNFMNNPDEETAVAQFGSGDKYFGVCTMMATMPGLPMFGHGQLEGFTEKYGMEYRRAYKDERPDAGLLARHEREIFPLLKRRRIFAEVENFLLYDLVAQDGSVNENVFAYSNGAGGERALVVYNNAYARARGRIRVSCSYAEKLPGGGKRQGRKSLAEAVGLFGGARGRERFLVMREQRSDLWYLRSSREITEAGLEVILEGYQCQVFLDIFEVEDDERGLYRAVHDALGGAGTPDLAAAVQDIALAELYAALAALVTPELLGWAAGLASPPGGTSGRRGAPAQERATSPASDIREPALAFYTTARAFLREAAAEEGLPGDLEPSAGAPAAATTPTNARSRAVEAAEAAIALAKRDAETAEAAANRFAATLSALASLPRSLAAPRPGRASAAGAIGPAADAQAAALVAEELSAPGKAQIALCFAVMDGLKELCRIPEPEDRGARRDDDMAEAARRMVDRYCLDRKFREALRESGMGGDEAFHSIAVAKTLLARLGEGGGAETPPREAAAEFLARGESDEEMRSLLGVNLFDGVTWFNKERFEEAARLGALLGTMLRNASLLRSSLSPRPSSKVGSAQKPRLDLLSARCALSFIDAASEAGYRLDGLKAALAREETGVAPTPSPRSSPPPKATKAGSVPAKKKRRK
jgi:hypothetical protein